MNKIRKIIFVFTFLITRFTFAQNITLSGYIREKGSQESLIGVSIRVPSLGLGTQTNTYGFYSLTIPKKDSNTIAVSMIGYQIQTLKISAQKNQTINIFLENQNELLDEVTIKANEPEQKSTSTKISTINIPIAQLKDVPSLMGEKDIIKAIQLLPGVQTGTEGSSGLFVRGGSADQNLILMDEAKLYNVSHLFGFFSVFNGDALKSIEFIKGGFPARYGGRVSSVLDVQMKDGSKSETHGEIGIGLITNRLTLETPIQKNKSSFIISARRTYPDLLFALFKTSNGVIKSNFHDINAKANFDLNSKNKLFFSTYLGKDNLYQRDNKAGDLYRNAGFNWGNKTGTLRWNHVFSPKVFSNLSLIYSKFNYEFKVETGEFGRYFTTNLDEKSIKYDVEFIPNTKHDIRIGINAALLNFTPNLVISKESGGMTRTKEIERIDATDAAIYIEDIYKINKQLSINYGLRFAYFKPKIASSYHFLEPRLAVNYNFTKKWSVKGGYSIMNQPIQLISNSGLGLSIDVWLPSSGALPPQHSQQFTMGLAHDLSKEVSIEIEAYHKTMDNIIAFKEGAAILSTVALFRDRDFTNSKVEWKNIATSGSGISKGLELFVHKNSGRLTGWTSYTLSKTTYQFNELNEGKIFFPNQDRRHQLALVGVYKQSKKLKFSGNFVLSTGSPITLPQLTYENFALNPFKNQLSLDEAYNVIDYGQQRNSYRSPLYNRLDLSTQFIKPKKHGTRTWEVGFYNILGSKNVFAYQIDINGKSSPDGFLRTRKIDEVSFLLFIPSISYYFKF